LAERFEKKKTKDNSAQKFRKREKKDEEGNFTRKAPKKVMRLSSRHTKEQKVKSVGIERKQQANFPE